MHRPYHAPSGRPAETRPKPSVRFTAKRGGFDLRKRAHAAELERALSAVAPEELAAAEG